MSIEGNSTLGAVTGQGVIYLYPLAAEATLGAVTGEAVIATTIVIEANATLGAVWGEAARYSVEGNATLGAVTGEAALSGGWIITGNAELPAVVGNATLFTGTQIEANVSLGVVTGEALFIPVLVVNGNATLGAVTGAATILQTLQATFDAWVMNTEHLGHGQYAAWTPQSIVQFNGKEYLFGATGIHRSGGLLDGATKVTTELDTGALDFGSDQRIYIRDAYFVARADDDQVVRVTTNEDTQIDLTLDMRSNVGMVTHRLKIGRGMAGNRWRFRATGEGNCEIARLDVDPYFSKRTR